MPIIFPMAGMYFSFFRLKSARKIRATTLGRNDGLTKLVIDPKTKRILGVGIAGKGAGDMIPEAALAVEMSALATDLSLTIHPHPTLSETIMEAADALYGYSTHIYRPKKS